MDSHVKHGNDTFLSGLCEDSCLFGQNFGKWDGTSPRKSAAFTADKEKFA